jgi:uncharacterized protein involved in exopolysaccharide biosynthesis
VDYRKHVGIVLKHRWLIAGIAAVALALGLLYTLLQTPTYRASATIQIKRAAANISGVAGLEPVEAGTSAEFYQTQYELLKSRALAERVVSSLNLAENPQLFEPPPSIMGTIRGVILASADAQARSDSGRQDWALDAVMSGLSVEPVRSSTIVRISFDSANPVLAQQVANAVAENFITSSLERSFEASEHARQFLEERLLDLRLKLEDSERELVAYAEEQDILLTGSDEPLSTVNLTGANSALAAAAKRRLERELQWRQVEAMGGAGLPPGLANEAIAKLRARRSQLVLEYEEKLKTRPGFPGMVQLRTRIEEIDQQISDEVNRIRESLRLQYEASVQEEQLLRQQLTGLKSEVMDYQNRNIQYTILQREVDTNRSLYEGLLQRYKEIGVAGGVDSGSLASNLSIVDRARIPGAPYKPSLSRNLATALLVGLMVGGAAAFGREFLDHSYRSPEDLEEDLGLPVLGIIPLTDDVSDLKRDLQRPAFAVRRGLALVANRPAVLDRGRRPQDTGRHQRPCGRGQIDGGGQSGWPVRQAGPARPPHRCRLAQALPASVPELRVQPWPEPVSDRRREAAGGVPGLGPAEPDPAAGRTASAQPGRASGGPQNGVPSCRGSRKVRSRHRRCAPGRRIGRCAPARQHEHRNPAGGRSRQNPPQGGCRSPEAAVVCTRRGRRSRLQQVRHQSDALWLRLRGWLWRRRLLRLR